MEDTPIDTTLSDADFRVRVLLELGKHSTMLKQLIDALSTLKDVPVRLERGAARMNTMQSQIDQLRVMWAEQDTRIDDLTKKHDADMVAYNTSRIEIVNQHERDQVEAFQEIKDNIKALGADLEKVDNIRKWVVRGTELVFGAVILAILGGIFVMIRNGVITLP